MPNPVTAIDVFIASPGDVVPEREAVRRAIAELNAGIYRSQGLVLRLLNWEDSVHPDVGVDAQDVINRQLDSIPDIFIGVLWKRFGTPTLRAESGTKEEFERALKSRKESGRLPIIMAYIKTQPVHMESQAELEQYSKVLEFKDRLKAEGCLNQHFDSVDQFERLVRMNLAQAVTDILRSPSDEPIDSRSTALVAGSKTESLSPTHTAVEVGVMDLIDAVQNDFAAVVAEAGELTRDINELGRAIGISSERLQSLQTAPDPVRFSEGRKVVDSMADQMHLTAKSLQERSSNLATKTKRALKNLSEGVVIAVTDFNNHNQKEELQNLLNVVDGLGVALSSTQPAMITFLETTSGFPRITTKFNASKAELVSSLKSAIANFRDIEAELTTTRTTIEKSM